MNNFTKQWLSATLAPESIANIKSNPGTYLDVVVSEDRTKKVFILSTDTKIQAIGIDYNSLLSSPSYTFSNGLNKIAELLEIRSISLKH